MNRASEASSNVPDIHITEASDGGEREGGRKNI